MAEVVLVLSAIMFVAVYFKGKNGQISGRFRLCLYDKQCCRTDNVFGCNRTVPLSTSGKRFVFFRV